MTQVQKQTSGVAIMILVFIVLILIVVAMRRQSNPLDAKKGVPAFHEGARVTLLFDKEEYFLGENILVHYCLENTNETPFWIEMGGDYRDASRSLRFKVTATDENDKPVDDPDPSEFCLGGLGSSSEVKPGYKHSSYLPLTRYRRFEKPGIYTIRVVHDLGWQVTEDQKMPFGENKIKLTMPTSKQAKQVVEEMYRLSKDSGASVGHSRPYADFSCLWYPVYLPILLNHAREGDEEALIAIGNMPTPEATKALISLLGHENREFVLKVAGTLNLRLHDPEFDGMINPRSPFQSPWDMHRRWLGTNSWRPDFASQILSHARDMLSWNGADPKAYAGFMIQSLGGKDDLPYLVKALDCVVRETQNSLRKENSYPEPAAACRELRRAAEILVKRGVEVPMNPKSPGEAVIFLAALKSLDEFRPEGWESTTTALLRHDIPYIRQLALQSLPKPLAKPFVDLLPTLLTDPDLVVRIHACNAAVETKNPTLTPAILKNVSSAKDEWLLRAAYNAAVASGARVEALKLLISRFDDTPAGWKCFCIVMSSVIESHGSAGKGGLSSQTAPSLRTRWSKFLQEHRQAIKAAHRFKPGDPELTPDLMPPEYKLHLQNGKQWP